MPTISFEMDAHCAPLNSHLSSSALDKTMRIKKLLLENFGPFRRYDIPFVDEEDACVLLTGKNNEGKSNIILALKLLSSACRTIGSQKMCIVIDRETFYKLPQQNTQGIEIGR
ncbi:MAG: ATP-binding protein, partial [Deltaproteobacteria bacterium]|nr:ATP-binding protein [Deltaproteobacteria bacterium]